MLTQNWGISKWVLFQATKIGYFVPEKQITGPIFVARSEVLSYRNLKPVDLALGRKKLEWPQRD